ncbi:MAG: hypothetical protein ABI380_14380 [Edaphobacter sp.]
MDKQNPSMKPGQPSKGGTQTGQQQAKPTQNPQQGGQMAPGHDDKNDKSGRQGRSGNK